MKFNKKIIYELIFIAKDLNKKYPHGYGIQKTLIELKGINSKNYDPKIVLEITNKYFSDDEFEVINALPIRLYVEE